MVKGWCPGPRRPMPSGDGLVVRARAPLGELTPGAARGLAGLAQAHASGAVELTNRGNLQLRGVSEAAFPALAQGLAALGLAGAEGEAEARVSVVLDPFRGLGDADAQTLCADTLAHALAAPEFSALPVKFGFVVDAGARRRLDGVSGDVRVEGADGAFVVRADGLATGRRAADAAGAAALALDLARWFLASGGVGADGRGRMRAHVAAGATPPPELFGDARPSPAAARPRPGPGARGSMSRRRSASLPPPPCVASPTPPRRRCGSRPSA